MTETLLYVAAVILLLSGAVLLLRRPRPGPGSRPNGAAEFFPVHCRFFPHVRQALSWEDAAFLAGRASPAVYRRWRKGRRRAGRMYLIGLRQDFAGLNRLARLLSVFSPRVKGWQEGELLLLNLRFQILYRTVAFRILLGRPAAEDLGRMAAIIGGLGSRLEQASLTLDLPAGAITP